jgi:DNA-binding SARP family transcriptional activator
LAEIARLDHLRLDVIEDRLAAELALGLRAELVNELEALVGEYPFRERFWGQLMVALYRSGRQADALEAYQAASRALADGHGLDPGPELSGCRPQSSVRTRRWIPSRPRLHRVRRSRQHHRAGAADCRHRSPALSDATVRLFRFVSWCRIAGC